MGPQGEQFQSAAAKFAAERDAGSIATMMRLALHATRHPLRRWAANWLSTHCGVTVIADDDEGGKNATAPKAKRIL